MMTFSAQHATVVVDLSEVHLFVTANGIRVIVMWYQFTENKFGYILMFYILKSCRLALD